MIKWLLIRIVRIHPAGSGGGTSLYQLRRHKLRFPTLLCVLLEKVGEEKELQDDEDNDKLDADNKPQSPPECHRAETVVL